MNEPELKYKCEYVSVFERDTLLVDGLRHVIQATCVMWKLSDANIGNLESEARPLHH